MNLTELKTAIQQFCENYESKFVSNLDVFIRNAEKRVHNDVQLPVARKSATLAEESPSPPGVTFLLPVDFLSPHSLQFAQSDYRTYLLQKDMEFLMEAYPDLTDVAAVYTEQTGRPQYYALAASYGTDEIRIMIAPRPRDVGAFSLALQYFALPESITTTVSGTSWLGTHYESVLLWGAIVEAYIFMKGQPDLIQTYETKFQQQMALLKELGDGKNRQDTYRVEQTRIPVT